MCEGRWSRDDDLEVRIWREINTDIPLPLPSNALGPGAGARQLATTTPATRHAIEALALA